MELVSLIEGQESDEITGQDSESEEPTERGLADFLTKGVDVLVPGSVPLHEDMFGMTTCVLVRDLFYLHISHYSTFTRIARITLTILFLTACVLTQVFLLIKIKSFVTARAVHDARVAYDAFETHLYDGNTHVLRSGYSRGIEGFFNDTLFHSFDDEEKEAACHIALSEPWFLFVLLTVWTLACVNEFKKIIFKFHTCVIKIPTIASMSRAMVKTDSGEESAEIVGLTRIVKVFIACIMIARFAICSSLLWLGCRWLLATIDFNELVLNAFALVFVLDLKEFFYSILVPARNQRDLKNTRLRPAFDVETPTPQFFLGAFIWLIVAVIWASVYMYFFQHVLPDYMWDIRDTCSDWMDREYALKNVDGLWRKDTSVER